MNHLADAQLLLDRAEGIMNSPATADPTADELTQLAIAKTLIVIAKRMRD